MAPRRVSSVAAAFLALISAHGAPASNERLPSFPSSVGTKKLWEDEGSVLWEMVVEPGERLPPHEHMYDYSFHVIKGSRLAVFSGADGSHMFSFDAPLGDTKTFKRRGDKMYDVSGKLAPFDAVHGVQNIGNSTYHELLFETKPAACAEIREGAEMGATRLDASTVRKISFFDFSTGSGAAEEFLASKGAEAAAALGSDASAAYGVCANAEREADLARGYTHSLMVDMTSRSRDASAGALASAIMALSEVSNSEREPILFDFYPIISKSLKESPPEGKTFLKHTVLLRLKSDAPVGDLIAGYAGLPEKIKEMLAFEWGPVANAFGDEASANGFEFGFMTTFADSNARDAYLAHEAHDAYAEELFGYVDDAIIMDFVPQSIA